MTIAEMRRLVLCGPLAEKAAALEALQALGTVHLVPLVARGPLEPDDPVPRRRADAAWRHLDRAPRKLRPWPAERTDDLDDVIAAALANKDRLRTLADRRDALAARVEALEPFGDFSLPPLDRLGGRRLWFYVVPVRERRALEALDLPWAVVGRSATRLNVAVVSETEPAADLLPAPRAHTGSHRLGLVRRQLEEAEIEIERAEAERAELTRHRLALGISLARAADADERRAAEAMTRDEGRLFALAGWAPVRAGEALARFAETRGLALTLTPPGPRDAPPTLLDQPEGWEEAGALTNFYMTPAYRGWDPSLIVFASFAAFFAMILADAGYAAALGLGLAAVWGRLGRRASGRRLRRMLAAVLAVAGVYGVLAGSYFGLAPTGDGLLAALDVIDLDDLETMMAVSVGIGVLHVSLANLQVAWRGPGPVRIERLGWVGATLSGLALWLAPGPAAGVGLALSLGAVAWGAAAGGGASALARAGAGALGLARVTRLFGDVLSYMRLFALGLASGSLAATFNRIAADTVESVPGAGVALAILVLGLGHGINLALGVLSGVVHGLRLNFIEFFGWGLTDEGYPFKPFARRETAP